MALQSQTPSSTISNEEEESALYSPIITNLQLLHILDQPGWKNIENTIQVQVIPTCHVDQPVQAACRRREEAGSQNAEQTSQSEHPGIPSLTTAVFRRRFLETVRRDNLIVGDLVSRTCWGRTGIARGAGRAVGRTDAEDTSP